MSTTLSSKALALSLASLLLCAAGCSATRTYEYDQDRSDPVPASVSLVRPVSLLVVPSDGQYDNLHAAVVRALEESGRFKTVSVGHAESGFDYVLSLRHDLQGEGKAINFLTSFPGFLFLMPSWYGLRWDCTLETSGHLMLRRSKTGSEELERTDAFEMDHTSGAFATAAYVGWLAPVFVYSRGGPLAGASVLAMPFAGGMATTFGEADFLGADLSLSMSVVGRASAEAFAAQVIAAIARDLQAAKPLQ